MSKFAHALLVSLEWRAVAFIVTNLFLWATTGSFWRATGLALALQLILFVVYTLWYFLRYELRLSLPLSRKQSSEGPSFNEQ